MKRKEYKYTSLIAACTSLTAFLAFAIFTVHTSAVPMIQAVKALA